MTKTIQNKHNNRRVTILKTIVSDTGNVFYEVKGEGLHGMTTYIYEDDMKHWFEVSTVRVNRKPKHMGEEE
tara:strand:+ start:1298 stop:1510 length:213 start_codon:yes stop_codon:yes gene_type:complete